MTEKSSKSWNALGARAWIHATDVHTVSRTLRKIRLRINVSTARLMRSPSAATSTISQTRRLKRPYADCMLSVAFSHALELPGLRHFLEIILPSHLSVDSGSALSPQLHSVAMRFRLFLVPEPPSGVILGKFFSRKRLSRECDQACQ